MTTETRPEFETVPARWFVATYGDPGLEVELFDDPLAYGRAVLAAKRVHEQGGWECDSFTYGDLTLCRRVSEAA